MTGIDDVNSENLCPKCGCNIIESRRDEKKNELFEKEYKQELEQIRFRAKIKRFISGMIIGAWTPPLLKWFIQTNLPDVPTSLKYPFNYVWLGLIILYALTFAWINGFVAKRRSKEEKKLWQNFDPPDLVNNSGN